MSATVPPAVLDQFENPQVLLSPDVANALRLQVVSLGPQGAQLFDALYGAIRVGLVGALHDDGGAFLVHNPLPDQRRDNG